MYNYKRPEVCVPIVDSEFFGVKETVENIKNTVESERGKARIDIIEFRADCYKNYNDIGEIKEVVDFIKNNLQRKIIFTVRSKREGGEIDISPEDYKDYLISIINADVDFDILDVEMSVGNEFFDCIRKEAHDKDKKIIASYHNFKETVPETDIIEKIKYMEKAEADIAKIALMPNEFDDVLTVMKATDKAISEVNIPVVTMSMGKIGLVTRLNGGVYGSSITFAAVGKTSAPGQISAEDVTKVLDVYENND